VRTRFGAAWLNIDDVMQAKLARVGHSFDAFITALVARAACLGLTDRPPSQLIELAAVEGWIHLPFAGALVSPPSRG
jgi:hypothetical protein